MNLGRASPMGQATLLVQFTGELSIYQQSDGTIVSVITQTTTRNQQLQCGILLEYLTMVWNLVEGS
jgi:hypothetical protein